ncbi:MAG: deoxynucleoside kinase [Clostridia bacterium]|nr:deoxynucleoside kinase [Clostridia bacterium]
MSLIVIEGLDGSGKGTQSRLLSEYLEKNNIESKKVTFPDYDSDSSALVKMYLAGDFGTEAGAVNAYAASSFFAVDRFASYNMNWKKEYQRGVLILADRYTTSNITYQLSKLDESEWNSFADWIYDYEFIKLGLPVPDAVIYLDMDPQVSQKLLTSRYSGDNSKKDIHENNISYLTRCRQAAVYAQEKFGWHKISCNTADSEPRSIDDIHNEIISYLKENNLI